MCSKSMEMDEILKLQINRLKSEMVDKIQITTKAKMSMLQ